MLCRNHTEGACLDLINEGTSAAIGPVQSYRYCQRAWCCHSDWIACSWQVDERHSLKQLPPNMLEVVHIDEWQPLQQLQIKA